MKLFCTIFVVLLECCFITALAVGGQYLTVFGPEWLSPKSPEWSPVVGIPVAAFGITSVVLAGMVICVGIWECK